MAKTPLDSPDCNKRGFNNYTHTQTQCNGKDPPGPPDCNKRGFNNYTHTHRLSAMAKTPLDSPDCNKRGFNNYTHTQTQCNGKDPPGPPRL